MAEGIIVERWGWEAAGPIVIRKKSSSRSVEKIRSWRPATAIPGDGGHYHKAENFTRIMSDVEIAGSAAGYPVASPVVIKIPSQWPHINSQHGVFLRCLRLYARLYPSFHPPLAFIQGVFVFSAGLARKGTAIEDRSWIVWCWFKARFTEILWFLGYKVSESWDLYEKKKKKRIAKGDERNNVERRNFLKEKDDFFLTRDDDKRWIWNLEVSY